MHLLCELLFLVLYQYITLYPRTSYRHALHMVLLVFVAGNLLDVLQYVYYKYGSVTRIRK